MGTIWAFSIALGFFLVLHLYQTQLIGKQQILIRRQRKLIEGQQKTHRDLLEAHKKNLALAVYYRNRCFTLSGETPDQAKARARREMSISEVLKKDAEEEQRTATTQNKEEGLNDE